MTRLGMKPHEITIPAVAKEARASVATIYRRSDLFTIVQRANPHIQCRQTEQVHQRTIEQLQNDLKKAQADAEYYQKEALLAKLGERRPTPEVIQLKKSILALQRQVSCLKELLAHCTCGAHVNSGVRIPKSAERKFLSPTTLRPSNWGLRSAFPLVPVEKQPVQPMSHWTPLSGRGRPQLCVFPAGDNSRLGC